MSRYYHIASQSKTFLKMAVRQCNPRQPPPEIPLTVQSPFLPLLIASLILSLHSKPLSFKQFGPSMSDCLQPVAFTSLLMEPSGRLIQFSSGWREGFGRVTLLHISQLGLLSVCSTTLVGCRKGDKGEESGGGEKKQVGRGQKVTGKVSLSLQRGTLASNTSL